MHLFSGKPIVYAAALLLLALLLGAVAFFLYSGSGKVSFNHGVASGDPLADRVILWTRVTPQASGKQVRVRVEVAKEPGFKSIIKSLIATASAESDYTVKVDVDGLHAGAVYYYRFRSGGVTSPVGRTKTLLRGDVNSVRLAVFSCANYPASHGGYFNVYGHAAKTAHVDAVVHLGDYIYEYGKAVDPGSSEQTGRDFPEYTDKELLMLADYRKRYALYRTDPQLQALHAAHPFITVWDDHEIANDAYTYGAQNHNEGEGSFDARKAAALAAYYEWMPVRPAEQGTSKRIYRSFSFGNLVELLMLDTRIAGREKQLSYNDYFDPDTGFDSKGFRDHIASPDRRLLGQEQLLWVQQSITTSDAVWQVLGQQVLMGRMNIPAGIIPYLGGRTPEVPDLIHKFARIKERVLRNDPSVTREEIISVNTVLPYNLDAWDGYPAEREAVLEVAYAADKNLVVLAGDTHNGWANNLKDAGGKQVGVEFATASVSSGGLETYLKLESEQAEKFARDIEVLIDDLVYSNTKDRGYLIVSFTREKTEARWIYVDTVKSREFRELVSSEKNLAVFVGKENRKVVSQ